MALRELPETAAHIERAPTMRTFEFGIIASGLEPAAEDFETRFYGAGCDDATISFQKRHIIADFAREAETLSDAIASAIEGVIAAGAVVDRIEPDPLVSLADMATRTGLTRAAMSHYSQGKRGRHFPAPVIRITSESPLWDWATVARWMYQNDKLDKETAVEAEVVRLANDALSRGDTNFGERLRKAARDYSASLKAA